MSKQTEETVARGFFECIQNGDLDGAFAFTTEDLTFRPIGSHPVIGKEFKGKQDILENCWMVVFQHLTEDGVPTTMKALATGDGIAFIEFTGVGTGRSGMEYKNEYVHIYRFRDGKICDITEYLDTELVSALLSQ